MCSDFGHEIFVHSDLGTAKKVKGPLNYNINLKIGLDTVIASSREQPVKKHNFFQIFFYQRAFFMVKTEVTALCGWCFLILTLFSSLSLQNHTWIIEQHFVSL